MASPSRLLHLPFKDPDGIDGHVLVRVSPTSDDSSSPSSPLDLELLATQGTEAFVATLQHNRVSRYRDSDSSCSDQEWENVLVSLLVDKHPIGDLDALAENKEEGYLTIDVRKKSSGRAQYLGTLRLRRSIKAREDAEVFVWCVEQVKARAQLEREVEGLRRKHAELEKLVAEETAHFQELERGKREFEALHDSFCRDLVNEKKLKIRTLEQVLSTAHVDKDKLSQAAAASSSSLSSSKRRTAITATTGASRKGKRKAGGPGVNVPGSDEETDDGVEKMDIDIEAKEESPDDDMSDHKVGMTTPETASESEPEPLPKPKPKPKPNKTTRTSATRKQPIRVSPSSSPARSSRKAAQPRNKKATLASEDEDDPEPGAGHPQRLPVKKKPAPAPEPADDESTASE